MGKADLVHDWDNEYQKGIQVEAYLDAVFVLLGYGVKQATRDQQRQGIDRLLTNSRTGLITPVEYKGDFRASETGNAFIETVSVDTAGKRGWAYTSGALYLIYCLPLDDLIYVISMATLRENLSRWAQAYKAVPATNQGYTTYGILVPLHELEYLSDGTLSGVLPFDYPRAA